MEKQVIFRDRQEFQAADPNHLQAYVRESFDHLIVDAVSDEKHFTGFALSAASATEAVVQPGRFYSSGAVYVSQDEQSLNLFQYVPLVTSKIVAVVAWGQDVDTTVEPRDFLVDLETGATEPQAVAMERIRKCEVNLLPGSESADPQPPVIQSGTLAVAYIYLTPSGIDRIEMQEASRLPNGYDHEQRIIGIEVWKAAAEPRISSIATDLAALAKKSEGLASRAAFIEIAGDIASVKDKLQLPASFASYDADAFASDAKTNAAHAGYAARVNKGVLFPFAASVDASLALFNPIDAAVKASSQNVVLPAYSHAERIKTQGYAGDISVSQYQVQTHTIRALVVSNWYWHYGWNWNYYARWYGWNYANYWWTQPWYGYWYSSFDEVYLAAVGTTSYAGALVAQSFLNANAMWMTRLGLYFTQIAPTGNVQVLVCECEAGKPNLQKAVAQVNVAAANLKKYPLETTIDVPHVLLEAGKRYAVVLITSGDHRVAVVSGNAYTQGTLFYGSDGDYFVGDLTKDLMFTIYGAQFARARTEVQLQPVSLAGGFTDLTIDAQHVIPEGCTLQYEIQPQGSGAWYPLGDAALRLGTDLTAPNLVNLRAVLLGTSDLQPAFITQANAITASRPATSVQHWSVSRTLGAATTGVTLKLWLSDWDAAHHTITPKIVTGGSTETAASSTVTSDQNGATLKTFTFTIPSSSAYEIKIAGTRDAGSKPFGIINRMDIAA